MSKKVIAILLISALAFSLACGCKNNDTESTSSTASKTESSLSSNTESSKQSESSTESSKQSESSTESSKQSESSTESSKQSESSTESSKQSESSTDKDYEEMMSYVNQLSPELTYEEVIEILGEPDSTFDGGLYLSIWDFGKYTIIIQGSNAILTICDSENDKETRVYPKQNE